MVACYPGEEGAWLEAGGVTVEKGDDEGQSTGCAVPGDDDEWPTRGITADTRQARVYCRCAAEGEDTEVQVILPDDAPFRASRKGLRQGRSKSFDADGNPVPEVRLLYALKTGRHDDRVRAVEAFPQEIWDAQTFGQMFGAMKTCASTDHEFRIFAGEHLARSAAREKGLSDWALWENVADDAAAFTRHCLEMASGKSAWDNHFRFIQAVKETAAAHRGLPAQVHVRKRWIAIGGIGEWKEISKTLGFDWLPSRDTWKKYWTPGWTGY